MNAAFFDIDTQLDFVLPSGALYAPGAEDILATIAALNDAAARHGSAVISTMDAHTEDDVEFQSWPPHCVAGTLGQRKWEPTLLARRAVITTTPAAIPTAAVDQILLEKQQLDCFTNPNLPALLRAINADRYVVYGVVTEYCVKCAAFGLLETGKPVEIVSDAVRSLAQQDADAVLAEFRQRGGRVVSSHSLLKP